MNNVNPPLEANGSIPAACSCATCRPMSMTDMRMILCAQCGNKRCPHAADHRNACTNSNEPGQPGSNYPLVSPAETVGSQTFQSRVRPWMMECFGAEISADRTERNHRFFEEATELAQACGMTASEAHQLVDYTYGRPVGERFQEVGGVMVTLAALCLANEMNMHAAGEAELARIWTKVEKIRAKQAAKPKHSPLPEVTPTPDLPRFPTVLRKMWSGGEVQAWLDEHVAPVVGETAYAEKRLAESLAEVYATILGDDAPDQDDSLNAIERVKKAAQVLRLEVDLHRAVTRADSWMRIENGLPAEPCSCLAMFKEDNDFGFTSKYAVQVEFGELKATPRDFTVFADYRTEIATDQITHWHPLPATPKD